MTTKQSEQSRERLQVKWLLLSFNENTCKTIHQAKLARNYKILAFEFSKIVKDIKGKFDRVYL